MIISDLLNKLKKTIINISHTPERIYLIVGMVGVVGFSLITPPFQGPDESFHYIRAQYISHGYVLPVDVKASGASLPQSIDKVINDTFPKNGIVGKPWEKYNLSQTKAALKKPLDSNKRYQPAMINYTAVPYLPAIPGIVLSNSMNFSPLVSMYFARLSLGFACIALIFLGIKLIPYKKYLIAIIALTPMLLFQQSMVSIDGVSYALLILFLCYVLNLYSRTEIPKNQWFLLGALCVAITLSKPLVFLFLPLILLLIKKKNASRWIILFAATSMIAFAGVSLYNASKREAVVDSNTPQTTNSSLQITNIVHHPKRFLRVMWNTYMTEYGDDEVRGVFGIFGPADTKYPIWMLMAYVTLIGSVALTKINPKDDALIPSATKYLVALICVVYFFIVNLAIYISFSPVDFNIVYGVQGRYFLPILIVAPLIAPAVLVAKSKRAKGQFVLYSALTAAVLVLLAIFIVTQRYYLYTA